MAKNERDFTLEFSVIIGEIIHAEGGMLTGDERVEVSYAWVRMAEDQRESAYRATVDELIVVEQQVKAAVVADEQVPTEKLQEIRRAVSLIQLLDTHRGNEKKP